MKALGILTNDNIFDERYISENEYYKKEIEEAIKELRELIAKDKSKNCDDCKNKIDGTYQEICSNCKRFYGCYFEAKEV